MILRRLVPAIAIAVLLAAQASVAAGNSAPRYVRQQVQLAPFERSHVFTLQGRSTATGCDYSYPDVTMPVDVQRWQVRDIGVDITTCTKLVEEGVPTASDDAITDTIVTARIGGSAPASLAPASLAIVTHSGYAGARFENIYGQTLTKDTTYVTWGISSGCVTSGSTYGEWTWNSVYYSLVSYGGSESRTCARELGETYSTYRNNISGCRSYFYWVQALGKSDGSIGGNRGDASECAPVWEHFDVVRTT